MLSRVAENLFWMGRYLERTEYLARYINVEYFSSLDSSHPKMHELAIRSIADMIGLSIPSIENEINEEEVLVAAALDENNPVSILTALFNARENARSVRDRLSTELWEAINDFYHFVANYPIDIYKTRGLSDFTTNVIKHCSNVRGRIQHSLLHDLGWLFIQLGINIESASQVVRILISKNTDIEEIKKLKLGKTINSQQWNNILDCVEASDMCRKYYTHAPNRETTIEFLLFNKLYPRSVSTKLHYVLRGIERINGENLTHSKIEHKVAKIIVPFQYNDVEDIDDNFEIFLDKLLSNIYSISDLICKEYFN